MRDLVPGGYLFTHAIFWTVVAMVAVVPYVIPSYIHALAWLNLFKNDRIGGAAGLFQFLFGISPPDWVSYGYFPIVVTLSLHYFPYTYLLVSAALSSIDSRLEESGEILGASRTHILRRITFPLVIPALLSSFILTFSAISTVKVVSLTPVTRPWIPPPVTIRSPFLTLLIISRCCFCFFCWGRMSRK